MGTQETETLNLTLVMTAFSSGTEMQSSVSKQKLVMWRDGVLLCLLAASLPLKVVPCPLVVPALHESLLWHARNEFDPGHEFMRGVFGAAAAELRER